jgi:hypothetical protein
MERLAAAKGDEKARLRLLLDPCRYVRAADQALQRGNRETALDLISQAYLAFDLCSAGCEHARVWDRVSSERNS